MGLISNLQFAQMCEQSPWRRHCIFLALLATHCRNAVTATTSTSSPSGTRTATLSSTASRTPSSSMVPFCYGEETIGSSGYGTSGILTGLSTADPSMQWLWPDTWTNTGGSGYGSGSGGSGGVGLSCTPNATTTMILVSALVALRKITGSSTQPRMYSTEGLGIVESPKSRRGDHCRADTKMVASACLT